MSTDTEPKGLYNKYVVHKADGSPVDPSARYLVLRLDAGEYVTACRAAAAVFARRVSFRNPQLAADLETVLAGYKSPFRRPDSGSATIAPGWSLSEKPICPVCGRKTRAVALHTGDVWLLFWDCECADLDETDLAIDWPFVEDWANSVDMEAAGFQVE